MILDAILYASLNSRIIGGDENNCGGNQCRVDLLSAITIFIKESPPELVGIPEVFYPAINLYQQAIRNSGVDAVIQCLHMIFC